MTPQRAKVSGALVEKLRQARIKLLFLHPFLGYLVTQLEDRVGERPSVPTAGTDGTVVHWNEAFLARSNADDVMFVLAHEALHCALLHLWRGEGRDEQAWNLACDAVVNDMLLEAGLRYSGALLQGAQGRSAEQTYEDAHGWLKTDPRKATVDDHGAWSEARTGEPEQRARADEWRVALHQARGFGRAPGALERAIEEMLEPRRDWRELLREGLSFPEDYQWVPTDRRFPDVLLPTLSGQMHRVVLAVDTSASIQGKQLAEFWAELRAIVRNNRCEARVLVCDAEIRAEYDEADFDVDGMRALPGGGGTRFVPVFERVEAYAAAGWKPEAVVYLTDLDGEFPAQAPDVRTLWLVGEQDAGKEAPFGEVVVIR